MIDQMFIVYVECFGMRRLVMGRGRTQAEAWVGVRDFVRRETGAYHVKVIGMRPVDLDDLIGVARCASSA